MPKKLAGPSKAEQEPITTSVSVTPGTGSVLAERFLEPNALQPPRSPILRKLAIRIDASSRPRRMPISTSVPRIRLVPSFIDALRIAAILGTRVVFVYQAPTAIVRLPRTLRKRTELSARPARLLSWRSDPGKAASLRSPCLQ